MYCVVVWEFVYTCEWCADQLRFTEVVLGLEWIKDTQTQTFIIDFLTQLKSAATL